MARSIKMKRQWIIVPFIFIYAVCFNSVHAAQMNPDTLGTSQTPPETYLIEGNFKDTAILNILLSRGQQVVIDRETNQALLTLFPDDIYDLYKLQEKGLIQMRSMGSVNPEQFNTLQEKYFPDYGRKGGLEGRFLSKKPIKVSLPPGAQKPVSIDAVCSGFPETFEGAVWYPSGNWYHYQDNQGHGNGSYFWQDRTCAAHGGSWSGDAILGGTSGGSLPCNSNYPNGLTCDSNASWLQYAYWITCIYQMSYARLNFWYQLNAEANYDYFKVLISTDGTNAYGYAYTGLYGAVWYNADLNLNNWYTLGNLANYSGGFLLWFEFCSDSSVNYPFGARLDDITITYENCNTGFNPFTDFSSGSLPRPESFLTLPAANPQEEAWKAKEASGSVLYLTHLPSDEDLYGRLVQLANRAVLDRRGQKLLGDYLAERLPEVQNLAQEYGFKLEILGHGGEDSFLEHRTRRFPEVNQKESDLSGYAFKDEVKLIAPPNMPRVYFHPSSQPLVTCLAEGFEGTVWSEFGGNWYHWQGNNPNATGKFYWIDDTCDRYTGSWQADAVRGGLCGQLLACGATYPPNLTCAYPGIGNMAWMKYKWWITCAAGASSANLITFFKLKSETNYDYLRWLFTVDDVNFYGYQLSGDYSTSWWTTNNDMKTWPTLGDLTGYAQVGLAFTFCSDGSIQSGFGAYMDDISIDVCFAPNSVSNPNPPSGSSVCSTPTLSWSAPSSGTPPFTYNVYVDGILKCSNITTPSCNPGALSNGLHSWYVTASNNCGTSTGPTWTFTQMSAPTAPSNPSPANGATVCSTPTLSWSPSNAPEPNPLVSSVSSSDPSYNGFGPSTLRVQPHVQSLFQVPEDRQPGPSREGPEVEPPKGPPFVPPPSIQIHRPNAEFVLDSSAPLIPSAAPSLGINYQGITYTGWKPPDTHIAVGGNYVLMVVNSSWAIFNKTTGANIYQTTFTNWFSAVNPPDPNFIFDPKIMYDSINNRWVFIALSVNFSTNQSAYLISVSQTSDPTGWWWLWNLDADLDGSNQTNNWADYPGLGYDQNAVFITSNQYQFGGGFRYVKIRRLKKSELYTGSPLGWYDFWDLRNSDLIPSFTVKPAHSFGNPGGEYFINTNAYSSWNAVTVWYMTNTGGDPPSLSRVATVGIGAFTNPPGDAPQLGGCGLIDTLDARTQDVQFMNNRLYTSFTDGYNWGSGSVSVIHLLEIDTTTWSPTQNVVYGADGIYYYQPTLYADSCGNIVTVFARSYSSEYPHARYTGKSATGSWEGSAALKSGESCYPGGRWGDYAGIGLDGSNQSFWIAHEYAASAGLWSTWIGNTTYSCGSAGPITYDVFVDGSLKCSNISINSCYPGALSGGNHNWYVVAKNSCGNTSGPLWGFYLDTIPPNVTGWNSLMAAKSGTSVNFSWSPISDAIGYNIYRDTVPNSPWGPSQKINSILISTTSYTDTPPLGIDFYYKIKAVDACGNESSP